MYQKQKYQPRPNDGTLGPNTKQHNPNAPQYTGKITFGQDIIQYLNECVQAGIEPVVYLGGWKKQNERGSFISLKANRPMNTANQPVSQVMRPYNSAPQQGRQQNYPEPRQQAYQSRPQYQGQDERGNYQNPGPNPNGAGPRGGYSTTQEPVIDPFDDSIPF